MKTVSTAVEELRDTVNEKIGEEKTAREEVMILVAVAATRTLVAVVEKTLVEMWRWKEGVGM